MESLMPDSCSGIAHMDTRYDSVGKTMKLLKLDDDD